MVSSDHTDIVRHAELREFVARDPNWVSAAEREALLELKKRPICNEQFFLGDDRDKLLFVFLFARKLNIKRTVRLMEKHMLLRQKLERFRPLTLLDLNPALLNSGMLC